MKKDNNNMSHDEDEDVEPSFKMGDMDDELDESLDIPEGMGGFEDEDPEERYT